MSRFSFCLMGMVVLGSQSGLVQAADPAPDNKVLILAPQAEAAMPPMMAEANRSGIVGGAAVYWMQPYFKNNPAFTVSTTTPTGPGGTLRTVTNRTDISQHMDVGPQLWLGYLSDSGWGARVRWWYFRQGTDQSVSVPAATPGTLTFLSSAAPLGFAAFTDNDGVPATLAVTSKLQLQVWDFEAMNNVQAGSWDLLFTGGLRFAHINQHYNAFAAGDSGGDAIGVPGAPIRATVLSGHSFHGLGPVLALEARRSLCDCGFALYSSARGALLFGSAKQGATDIFRSGAATFVDGSSETRDTVVPVVELELGLEYGRNIGSSHVFGQLALTTQQWWGAGSASRSANTNSFGVPTAGGAIVDSDLGFLGIAFRVGVNY